MMMKEKMKRFRIKHTLVPISQDFSFPHVPGHFRTRAGVVRGFFGVVFAPFDAVD